MSLSKNLTSAWFSVSSLKPITEEVTIYDEFLKVIYSSMRQHSYTDTLHTLQYINNNTVAYMRSLLWLKGNL